MANEMTFSIIKPNAVKKNNIGGIINKFEKAGLKIAASLNRRWKTRGWARL